jgi:hypothetical protein
MSNFMAVKNKYKKRRKFVVLNCWMFIWSARGLPGVSCSNDFTSVAFFDAGA